MWPFAESSTNRLIEQDMWREREKHGGSGLVSVFCVCFDMRQMCETSPNAQEAVFGAPPIIRPLGLSVLRVAPTAYAPRATH